MTSFVGRNDPQLSVVIVNHNSSDYLIACVDSITRTAGPLAFEIIVVDNASEPASVDQLHVVSSAVTLIRSPINVGFSTANNVGILAAKGGYLLFLNPDTVVHAGTLKRMIEFMDSQPDVGASTCYVRLPDGSLDDAAHRGFPTPWNALCQFSGLSKLFPRSRLFSGYSLGWQDVHRVHDIEALAGCFMLVRRCAGEEAGWWDEDYFFYGEDLDFCYTLNELGWRISFVPDCSILHYKGMSSGIKKVSRNRSAAGRVTRELATRARFSAMKIFYDKHYADRYPWLLKALVLAGIALKQEVELRRLAWSARGSRLLKSCGRSKAAR
jgi:GT2 family glycosyltransferase